VEMEELLERRRRIGADRNDEMWNGVLHMNPSPTGSHADLLQRVSDLLMRPADDAGLVRRFSNVNIGTSHDYRIPDGVLQREALPDLWQPTAALAIEIRSPNDETWEKLPHYAECGVDELLIIDPRERTVTWLALAGGEYQPTERSNVIPLGSVELAAQLDWPPLED
jgi:Uma2 family endonuclease